MQKSFTVEELKELLAIQNTPAISLYMPLIQNASDANQNLIRFDTLVKRARDEFNKIGVPKAKIEELIGKLESIKNIQRIWEFPEKGLVALVSTDLFKVYASAIDVPEYIAANDRFHLKFLLPLIYEDKRFYILALSQKEVRFLECDEHSCVRQDLNGLPEDFSVIMDQFQYSDELQFRSGPQGAAFYQSQGAEKEHNKHRIHDYFKLINESVFKAIKSDKAPLVLACVDYYYPIYKEVNSYKSLFEDFICGNPDSYSNELLHQKAMELLKPHFDKEKNDALKKFKEIAGTMKATDDIKEIVKAAYQGRIESIILDKNAQIWGKYTPEEDEVVFENGNSMESYDLIDFAASHTVLNHGRAYLVEDEKLKSNTKVEAILRY